MNCHRFQSRKLAYMSTDYPQDPWSRIEAALNELELCEHEPGPPRDGRCTVHEQWWPCTMESVRRILLGD